MSGLEQPEFFSTALSTTRPVDALFERYAVEHSAILAAAEFMRGDKMKRALAHYLNAAKTENRTYIPISADSLFNVDMALSSLNAEYWSRALALTDVLDYMPSKKRDDWHEQIRTLKAPAFERDTVHVTLEALMHQRIDFLAEMVDGIFTGLSGEHVTNRPEGFGKRMIIDYVFSIYSMGKKSGLIHDMRCVIAKFMGRDQPGPEGCTRNMLDRLPRDGSWHLVDGGAFRIRAYKKGTAHIEINQDIAYRLNQILAYLHPMAIPAPHRKRPSANPRKDFELIQNPIPFSVINVLSGASWDSDTRLSLGYEWLAKDKHVKRAVSDVIEAIGGAPTDKWCFSFDYPAKEVVYEMLRSGIIPDQKSHQFYPTPEELAGIAVGILSPEESNRCLEPSAGQGGLADFLQKDATTCIEVSGHNCTVLRAKGYAPICVDFLTWHDGFFDKILMNPPFSQGRAEAHVLHACSMLAPGGRLVAIVPASMQKKLTVPDKLVRWHGPYHNRFSGTSVSVAIAEITNDPT